MWHGLFKLPGIFNRANNIIATMHNHRWNPGQTLGIGEKVIIIGEEATVDEIVTFNPGKGISKLIISKRSHRFLALFEAGGGTLPN